MKTISLLAAMFLTAALAGPAAEAGKIPFNGTMQASESYQFVGDPPFLFFVNGTGTANTTQLGQLSMFYAIIVDNVTGDAIESARFMAANGDLIFTSATAVSGETADPNVFFVVETYTVTGGTGRFADAKGSFTLNRLVYATTSTTSGSFNGSIILRGNQ